MARLESVAIAGYYATPTHLIPRIAGLLKPVVFPPETTSWGGGGETSFMDPCAGDGATIEQIVRLLIDDIKDRANVVDIFTAEMEASRAQALKDRLTGVAWTYGKNCVAGDAFRITFAKPNDSKLGVGLLYLNPPYDTDSVHGRLEHRFLHRFTNALSLNGVLLFVVPFYALKASAELLGKEYSNIRCFRFPAGDFEVYKQVVLVAYKSETRLESDPKIVAEVLGWAADASTLPELPEVGGAPIYSMPVAPRYRGGVPEWTIRPVDLTAIVSKVQPWTYSTRMGVQVPMPGVLPDVPVQDLLLRTYKMAVPPRPAHIAAGIASGLFNGARIDAAKKSKLPSLLVKGVFDREYRTVEERKNKDGEVTTVVQVQQPKLVTTVLDLSTRKYHVLAKGTEATGSREISNMNVADLLEHYGDSLMSVMEKQCPVLYDPRRDADSVKLAESPRRLFTAQSHATKAIIKLLGGVEATKLQRKNKSAILLGEIGSGKSTVALMAARSINSKRPLIMCPPHLLDGWKEQVEAVVPDAEVRVLSDVDDLRAVAEDKTDRMIVSLLSRETAKLSHAWDGVHEGCPKCGAPVSEEPETIAKKRIRCETQQLVTDDWFAQMTRTLAFKLLPYAPDRLGSLGRGRFSSRRIQHHKEKKAPFNGLPSGYLDETIDRLVQKTKDSNGSFVNAQRALMFALLASGSDTQVLAAANKLYEAKLESTAREVLLLLGPGHPGISEFVSTWKGAPAASSYGDWGWNTLENQLTTLGESKEVQIYAIGIRLNWTNDGGVTIDSHAQKSLSAAVRTMETLAQLGSFSWSSKCGEELFVAIPEPRRVALAKHIVRYYRNTFDFLVLDEGHEYATDGSAQERSAHRLTSLGLPTVLMTGTIMNGYAESLFMNMWALSPEFRVEFGREDRQRFVDRYGYRKRAIQDKDEEGKVVEFGSQSDRVTRSERIIGSAPGVLPLFLLRHLLPLAVTLHKADLAIDLPACRQFRHEVDPGSELTKRFNSLKNSLVERIRKDQFVPDRAGRLFGQLAELPSYLDRATADVGNSENGDYEIRYPESLENELVASYPGFDSDTLLPKEEWLLDLIESKLAEGRNVLVFSWHVGLLPRLSRLIEKRTGEKAPILYANKVATGKRQEWINREILKKKRRVLITNPVAIQTGLNNLVHFSVEAWMENPACNPTVFRQAIGRVDRIGQARETEIHFPVYQGTLQSQLYDLLMKKVAVSVSTDGLDPESALQAAGLGEDEYLTGLSIGKQLWSMIGGMDSDTVIPMDSHRHAPARRARVGT